MRRTGSVTLVAHQFTMIISYMPFFNELDLLEVKLQTMAPVVDKFVICEATHTYTGIKKPMLFRDNRELFKDFPIHYVEVRSLEGDMSPWVREDHQRGVMYREAMKLNPTVLVSGDVDEIVRPESIKEFVRSDHVSMAMEFDWLQYYFNRESADSRWTLRTISRDGKHHVGVDPNIPVLRDAGWHFNLCSGGLPGLIEKLDATSHAFDEYNPAYRKALQQGIRPDLDKTRQYDESRLPEYIKNNREKYKSYFL